MHLSLLSPLIHAHPGARPAILDLGRCSFRARAGAQMNQRLSGRACEKRTELAQSAHRSALWRGDFQGAEVTFFDSNRLDDLSRRLADSVPESFRAFGREMEGNFKAVLQSQLAKLDLVSRQEFDVQAALLERTQAKLAALEARLKELETKI
jgi:BMFP domain-containing protein YqiC